MRAPLAPRVPSAEVFHWNPRRSSLPGRLGAWSPVKHRVNNFGDLLGPLVVAAAATRAGRDIDRPTGAWQLMSVGSVLHFAREGAVVWGTGINGKVGEGELRFRTLDVRAVRGPRTAERLRARGIAVPDVFGDPGALFGTLFPDVQFTTPASRLYRAAIVPNLNDGTPSEPTHPRDVLVDPRADLRGIVRVLANSELVVGSSLHGLVIAESFGVPARMVVPAHETLFKYQDYYEGTGRPVFTPASSVAAALDAGGERLPAWDPRQLLEAFPAELWHPAR